MNKEESESTVFGLHIVYAWAFSTYIFISSYLRLYDATSFFSFLPFILYLFVMMFSAPFLGSVLLLYLRFSKIVHQHLFISAILAIPVISGLFAVVGFFPSFMGYFEFQDYLEGMGIEGRAIRRGFFGGLNYFRLHLFYERDFLSTFLMSLPFSALVVLVFSGLVQLTKEGVLRSQSVEQKKRHLRPERREGNINLFVSWLFAVLVCVCHMDAYNYFYMAGLKNPFLMYLWILLGSCPAFFLIVVLYNAFFRVLHLNIIKSTFIFVLVAAVVFGFIGISNPKGTLGILYLIPKEVFPVSIPENDVLAAIYIFVLPIFYALPFTLIAGLFYALQYQFWIRPRKLKILYSDA